MRWEDKSPGLGIRECYGVAGFDTHIISGAQDNGFVKLIDAGTRRWEEFSGGDGMSCVAASATEMYYSLQGGYFQKYNPQTGANSSCIASATDLETTLTSTVNSTNTKMVNEKGNFVNRAVDFVNGTLYVGYKNVYKSTNLNSTPPTFDNISEVSGDEYIPSDRPIDILAVDPNDINRIYFSVAEELYFTTNGGAHWNKASTIPYSGMQYITDIVVHPTDHTIWYTCSGYDEHKKVFKASVNGTDLTITNITSAGLPNLPVNTIVYGGTAKKVLYVGTDCGVYYLHDCPVGKVPTWKQFNDLTPTNSTANLPNVVIADMQPLKTSTTPTHLLVGTHGRGVWRVPFLADSDLMDDCTCTNDHER